jgi:hypothetical protein
MTSSMKSLVQAPHPGDELLLPLFQRLWVTSFFKFSILTVVGTENVQSKLSATLVVNGFIDPTCLAEDKTSGDEESNDEAESVEPGNDETLKRKRASSEPEISSTSVSSTNKSRRTSIYQTAAETTKDGMRELGDKMNMALSASQLPSTTRFDQCLPILSAMRKEGSLAKEDYLRSCRFLMHDENRASMFIGMDEDLRMEWLEMEFSANL